MAVVSKVRKQVRILSQPSLSASLESVHCFAFKLASNSNLPSSLSLHSQSQIPSLSYRHHQAKHINLFKIYHNHIHFSSSILQLSSRPCYPLHPFILTTFFSYPPKTFSVWLNAVHHGIKYSSMLCIRHQYGSLLCIRHHYGTIWLNALQALI